MPYSTHLFRTRSTRPPGPPLVRSFLAAAILGLCGVVPRVFAQNEILVFSAMGDVPYGSGEVPTLQRQIRDHNSYSPSEFMVHVGDIKSGSDPCSESYYSNMVGYLDQLAVPTYIIPGDNETTDCSNSSQAWSYWTRYFTDFEQRFCGTPPTEHQSARHENWAFTTKGVLCVGIDMPSPPSSVNQTQWDAMLQQDADWVSAQMQAKASSVRCAVVFSQDGPGDNRQNLFFTRFRAAAATFAKPVLLLHGDDHSWKLDHPFPEPNILRVCVNNGGDEDPVQVTVSLDPTNPFQFRRDPWSSSPQIYNAPPCVVAGADLSVTLPATAALDGAATDDGDPSPPGGLALQWSRSSGPANVDFADPTSGTTTTAFGAPGNYVLRLTADDGQRQGWDEVAVVVTGTAATPAIAIADAGVAEGDSGTVDARFTVSLTNGSGGTVSVDWSTAPGTAAAGIDYGPASGTLQLVGTSDSRTIAIPVLGDLDVEPDETFFVNLSNASAGTIARPQATGTISNDDSSSLPPPPPPAGGDVVLTPTDDTKVTSSSPGSSYGNSTTLRVKSDSVTWDSYLRFEVHDIEGMVARATLQLYCTDASDHAGFVYVVGDDYLGTTTPWVETGLQFDNAPGIAGQPLNPAAAATAGAWVEFDVGAAVQGDGTICLGIHSPSGDSAYYSSKEGLATPRLVLQTAPRPAGSPGPRPRQQLADPSAKAGGESPSSLPFRLGFGVPNPTRGATELEYTLPRSEAVALAVFDVRGRLIRRIQLGPQSEGRHRIRWDGLDAGGRRPCAGVYFLRLEAGSRVAERRLVVLR